MLMSGQATIYDADKRRDALSEFGKKYLDEVLKKPQTSEIDLDNKRLDLIGSDTHNALKDQIESCKSTNLFGASANATIKSWDAPAYAFNANSTNFNALSMDGNANTTNLSDTAGPTSYFFTLYSTDSFFNPGLQQSMNVHDQDEIQQKKLTDALAPPQNSFSRNLDSEFTKLISRDIAPVNRFNVSLMGAASEEKMQQEQDQLLQQSAPLNPTDGQLQKRSGTDGTLGAASLFGAQIGNLEQASPFGMSLQIPPLPSVAQRILVDPADERRGEKLITKTFFSFGPGAEGDSESAPFLSIKERKVVS